MIYKLNEKFLGKLEVGKYLRLADNFLYEVKYKDKKYYLKTDMECDITSYEKYLCKEWTSLDDMANDLISDIEEIISDVKKTSFKINVIGEYNQQIIVPDYLTENEIKKYIQDYIYNIPIGDIEYIPETDYLDEDEEISIY